MQSRKWVAMAALALMLIFSKTAALDQNQISAGYLNIDVNLPGIPIIIDNKQIGVSPMTLVPLDTGRHTINALNPHRHLWGQLDFFKEIYIQPMETLTVKIDFPSLLSIRTEPDRAEVRINDQFMGKTPLNTPFPDDLTVELLLQKDGFQDFKIKLDSLEQPFLSVKLKEIDEIFNLKKFLKNQQQRQKSRYRRASYGFWTMSVLTGLSSIYFKRQADDNYQSYLNSGSYNKMNRYYDRTIQYDHYTNICLGLFQGCLFLSFYFMMKSYP